MIEDQEFLSLKFDQTGLPDTHFEYCQFRNCNFSNVNLHEVSFMECEFDSCNFSNALISKTAFKDVKFKDCKMVGLELTDASPFLLQFYFENCQLDLINFYDLDLSTTVFKNCSLKEVDFSQANLEKVIFDHCDLTNAKFEQSNLSNADLRTAFNFNLIPAQNTLKGTRFSSENIRGLLSHLDIKLED